MALETTRFDVLDYLGTAEDRAAYIEAVIEEGDSAYLIEAIGNVARAQGASAFAAETGLSRETVYKAFIRGGNPTVDTLFKALAALGLKLTVKAA
ncbi:probable addiction module antidote protein [Bosea sp. CRIB-10]|uniref:addiction module antidote protein n=1 Tax=Bosea sp. CRIB-10 TaxID=378404 RepID=UPI0008E8F6A9|nr:addiction module antidote protein [Bosea sp. CRIB-10]SFD34697.1 probable addiction module antidote protein [Bosea sp. CRIB-10]